MKRKLLSFLFAVFATTYFCSAQVVFDPATYSGTLPAGMSIVNIGGTNYLQVILNGWSSTLPLDPIVLKKSTSFTVDVKYAVGTPGTYPIGGVNTFLKLASPGNDEIAANGAASTATFAKRTVTIATQDTLGYFQVAGQNTTNWGAVTGDTLWVGKLTILPDPTRFIARETFGTQTLGTGTPPDGKLKTSGDTLTGWKNATNCTYRWDDSTALANQTSTNGHIESGSDSSIRTVNYGAGITAPVDYPSPSYAAAILLTDRTRPGDGNGYMGSWDTAVYKGINLQGYIVKSVQFGYFKNGNNFINADTNALNVMYRIDGGAWVQLDTTLIPSFASGMWKYITLPIDNEEGGTCDILLSGLNKTQCIIDDIALVGQLILSDSVIISATEDTIKTSLGTSQFSAVVYPDTARQWVAWSVSSPIATIDADGLLTAVSNGKVNVIATTDDGITKTFPIVIYGQKPVPMPIAVNVVGSKDNALDYTGTVAIGWEADTVFMDYIITDDSIVNGTAGAGNNYQVDNIEIYFDLDNSKIVHWPRNGGYVSGDATFDDNDHQLRLVLGLAGILDASNAAFPAKVVNTLNDTGYTYSVRIAWEDLMTGFTPVAGDTIGFDVLLSDNDAVASDANRNQFTWVSPTDKPFNDPSLWGSLSIVDGGAFLPIADVEKPTAPVLTVETGNCSALLTWTPSEDNTGVMSYIIKEGIFNVDTILAKQTGNTLTRANLTTRNYPYQVSAIDNHGNVSAWSNSVSVDATCTDVDIARVTNFGIYPNPVANELYIDNAASIATIEIISMNGNVIIANENNVQELISVNVTELTGGMYFVRMTTVEGKVVMSKFVKK
jgi:hypothetical protein